MDETHHIEIRTGGIEALVRLNGCTVFEAWDGGVRVVEHPLRPWLLAGENRLEAWVGQRLGDEEALFRVTVHRFGPGGRRMEMNQLVAAGWAGATPWAEALEPVVTHAFHSIEPEPPWGLGPLGDRSGSQRAIEAVLAELHRAFGARDAGAVRALLLRRTGACAEGLGLDPDEVALAELEWLDALFGAERLELAPLHLTLLRHERSADERLVHPRRASGRPPISGTADGVPFGLGVSFGNIEGAWQIVR